MIRGSHPVHRDARDASDNPIREFFNDDFITAHSPSCPQPHLQAGLQARATLEKTSAFDYLEPNGH